MMDLVKRSQVLIGEFLIILKIRKNSRAMQQHKHEQKLNGKGYGVAEAAVSVQLELEDRLRRTDEELTNVRDLLRKRDTEIDRLKREIHKLKVS